MTADQIPPEAMTQAAIRALQELLKWPTVRGALDRERIRELAFSVAAAVLDAAQPILVREAVKSAAKEQFEAAIAEVADGMTKARLAEIQGAVRAAECERIIALIREQP